MGTACGVYPGCFLSDVLLCFFGGIKEDRFPNLFSWPIKVMVE